MKRINTNDLWAISATLFFAELFAVPCAWGEAGPPPPSNPPRRDEPAATLPRPAPSISSFGNAVDAQRLGSSRAGASTMSTQVDIGGVLKDTTASNISTGNNAIREGSFSNAVGFNTVIQNSGANVLIQNSMTVNVEFR